MRREKKYPDTRTFHYYNANPMGRITGDCVVRAITVATEMDYNEVVLGLALVNIVTGYTGATNEGMTRFLEANGWVKHKQPRKKNGTKYTGNEFCRLAKESGMGRIVANIGGHHAVAIVDGKVWDTWNSTGGCIGNYWTKG